MGQSIHWPWQKSSISQWRFYFLNFKTNHIVPLGWKTPQMDIAWWDWVQGDSLWAIWFRALGALDSITKYFQMSLEAEKRVNASTTDPSSTVEQSELTRESVEHLMMEQETQFREKQAEQARLLDELAGKLQSLDLSAAAEMVRLGGLASKLWCYRRKKTPCLVFNIVHFADEPGVKPQWSHLWPPMWGTMTEPD